jgi:hypothetical protein
MLCRKPFNDNIFKQWELGHLMAIKLVIEIGKGGTEKGRCVGEVMGCWVLWPLCVFGCVSVVVEGACIRDYRGWGCVQFIQ